MSMTQKAARALSAMQRRVDAWYNSRLGYGTSDDATSAIAFQTPLRIAESTLEGLYVGDSLAHRVVSAVVDDALRQGWTFTSETNPEAAERLHKALDNRYEYTRALMQWCKESRLYGGIGLFVRADDGTEWTDGVPLRRGSVREVVGFEALKPRDLQDTDIDRDPLSPNFGRPSEYRVYIKHPHGASFVGENIHASRVIRIEHGIKLTERLRDDRNDGFPESVLLPVMAEIERYRTAFAAINAMMSNASQPIYKIKNLLSMLSTEDGPELLRARFDTIDQIRSSVHSVLLDSDGEDFSRVATPMSELANLIDRYMLAIAQAANMPLTRLFGMSPAGLNATGDADIRNWYDTVQAYRELQVEPLLRRFVSIASMDSEIKDVPQDLTIEWPSLWQLNPQELAATRLQVAQADQIYLATGVAMSEDVALTRMQPNGWGKDLQIDRAALERDSAPLEPTPSGEVPELEQLAASAEKPQDAALNGAQVTALLEIVGQAARQELPRETALETIVLAFPTVSRRQADVLLGTVGKGFVPKQEGEDVGNSSARGPGATSGTAPEAQPTSSSGEGNRTPDAPGE